MKVTMNLLPVKYKCIPRDVLAIYVALLLIFGVTGEFFALKWWFNRQLEALKQLDQNIIQSLKDEIANKDRDIGTIDERLKRVQVDPSKIRDTNIQIDFFNQIYQRHFSWYEFFDKLEAQVPANVWIKDIKMTGTTPQDMEFELSCEASEVYHAPAFLKNLMRHKEFMAPKNYNAVSLSSVQLNAEQGNEFSIKMRFLPFKNLEVYESAKEPGSKGPTTLKMKVGEKKKIEVLATNIADEKVKLGEDNVEVQQTKNLGVFNPRDMEFTATTVGDGELLINTDDKKLFAKLKVEVTN
jgi:Tfp pilus assembly protein PilN